MPLIVPPAVNYQNPVNSLPAIFSNEPPEGPRLVPCEIDWGAMGGPNNCVAINLFGGAAMTLSQIAAISCDNSHCGADVQFIFTDTQQTYTVPAYVSIGTFPVFTNATSLFVLCAGANVEDSTRFALLNTMPPPVAFPLPEEQQTAVFNDIPVATGLTALLPSSVNGTLEGVSVGFQFVSTACNVQWILEDSETPTPKLLLGGQAAASPFANNNQNVVSFNQNGLRLRFEGGINFSMNVSGSGTAALAFVNLFYRSP